MRSIGWFVIWFNFVIFGAQAENPGYLNSHMIISTKSQNFQPKLIYDYKIRLRDREVLRFLFEDYDKSDIWQAQWCGYDQQKNMCLSLGEPKLVFSYEEQEIYLPKNCELKFYLKIWDLNQNIARSGDYYLSAQKKISDKSNKIKAIINKNLLKISAYKSDFPVNYLIFNKLLIPVSSGVIISKKNYINLVEVRNNKRKFLLAKFMSVFLSSEYVINKNYNY